MSHPYNQLSYADSVAVVELAYQATLNRTAEAPGLDFWTSQFEKPAGFTPQQLVDGILSSSEYQHNHAGQTVQQQIDNVYFNVLGRHGTTDELNYWAADANGLADAIVLIDTSSEAAVHNQNGLLRAELTAINDTVPATVLGTGPLDNSPLLSTVTVTVPGPTVYVPEYISVPTAEQHHVIWADHASAPPAFTNPDGTLVFSHGAPSNDMTQVVDLTSGFQFYFDVHERQLAPSFAPTGSVLINNVLHETFHVPGGTQNNSAGVNAARADGAIDFVFGGAPGALLNPDYQTRFHTTWNPTAGTSGFTDGHIVTSAAGVQQWIVDTSSVAALVGQNIRGDDPASTTYSTNGTNLGFVEFGGNPNAHGTYSMEVDQVKVTGLGAGQVVAGYHADIITT